jgi:tetraacyldisaccharide 4'-kinase
MMTSMINLWYQSPRWFWWLWPAQILFKSIVKLRKWAYHNGVLPQTHVPIPVVMVGNLDVGGSGKTPVVIALVELLIKHGYKPGVISRGYGRKSKQIQWVCEHATSHEVGDEALLIYKKTQCPMVVASSRVKAAKALVDDGRCNVIVSDDGLQHYALARSIEIALEYVHPKMNNHCCLPLGPYREHRRRFAQVDFHLQHGPHHHDVTFELGTPYRLNHPQQQVPWESLNGQKVYVVAGIAKPQRLYQSLKDNNLDLNIYSLADHGQCSSDDLTKMSRTSHVIMTEKDAVKYPAVANNKVLVVPYKAIIPASTTSQLLSYLDDEY